MNYYMIFSVVIVVAVVALHARTILMMQYRESYYRQRCINRGIDTSKVDNMSLREMMFS